VGVISEMALTVDA